jgi:hypothetical protein
LGHTGCNEGEGDRSEDMGLAGGADTPDSGGQGIPAVAGRIFKPNVGR